MNKNVVYAVVLYSDDHENVDCVYQTFDGAHERLKQIAAAPEEHPEFGWEWYDDNSSIVRTYKGGPIRLYYYILEKELGDDKPIVNALYAVVKDDFGDESLLAVYTSRDSAIARCKLEDSSDLEIRKYPTTR